MPTNHDSQAAPDPKSVRKMMIDKDIKPGVLQRRFKRARISVWRALRGQQPALLRRIARYVESR